MDSSVVKRILSLCFPALGKVRGVMLSAVLDEENYEMLKSSCHGICRFIDLNLTSAEIDQNYKFMEREGLLEIDVPVVGIMGMWDYTDKFEVSLALREKFIDNGYKVSQIGSRNYCELLDFHSFPRFMLDPTMGEVEKIFMLNRYLKRLVDEESPDIIFITIPGGTQQLNNQFPNRFGVLPFLVSKAVTFDALILCTLYEPQAGELFEMISTSFKYKYGCEVDAFHMSNTIFDAASVNEREVLRLSHIFRSDVSKIAHENYVGLASPMMDVYSAGDAEKLFNVLVDKLTKNIADAIFVIRREHMAYIRTKEQTLESICVDILDILKEKFDVQEPKVQRFFGLEGLINARELVYLVHILEDRYHINFTAEDMDEERFLYGRRHG